MKKIWISLLGIGAALLLGMMYMKKTVDTAGEAEKDYKIVIDPGHGGIDPGMTGVGGLQEKEINLEIALTLQKVLTERQIKTVLTREEDRGLYEESTKNKKAQDLQTRIQRMKEENPVLAISIHQNSYEDSDVFGPQVFYYKTSDNGKKLAECIQEAMNSELEIKRPRVAKANETYYLLKRSECILNIVECGFLTNPEEAALLKTKEYQEKVAIAIADGIDAYLEMKDK